MHLLLQSPQTLPLREASRHITDLADLVGQSLLLLACPLRQHGSPLLLRRQRPPVVLLGALALGAWGEEGAGGNAVSTGAPPVGTTEPAKRG